MERSVGGQTHFYPKGQDPSARKFSLIRDIHAPAICGAVVGLFVTVT